MPSGQGLSSTISLYLFALIFPSTDATVPDPNHEIATPYQYTERGLCETYPRSLAFFHTFTFIFANIIILSLEKIIFFPIIFNRPFPLFTTQRQPILSIHFFNNQFVPFYSSFKAIFV